jgi:methyl-accepting chemotaxis protein
MDAITKASGEQSTSLDAVNRALGTLDHVTQQNVSMVERTDAATNGLASEASHLREMVGRFKLSDGQWVRHSNAA